MINSQAPNKPMAHSSNEKIFQNGEKISPLINGYFENGPKAEKTLMAPES